MEVLYYPYWNIAFIPGLILFSSSIILLIICLAVPKKEKSSVTIVKNFYLYSQNLNPWIIFGKVITVIYLILLYIMYLLLLSEFHFNNFSDINYCYLLN